MTTAPRNSRTDESPPRRGPGRPAVPLDRIIATALRIVDEQGADALTMRSLAQALDSGTSTLYRHFVNRDELVAQVVDRAFGEAALAPDQLGTPGWQEACRVQARTMFDALARHRNLAPLLVQQVITGPNAMLIRERSIANLLDNGFAPHLAARSYATIARYILGFAIQLAGQAESEDAPEEAAALREADPTRYPATAEVSGSLPVPLEDEFDFGLELLLAGLSRLRDNQR